MTMKRALPARVVTLLAGAVFAPGSVVFAQSAVYRCVDENGRPQYTNVKADTEGKKCTVITREVSVVPAPAAGTPQRPVSAPPASAAPNNSAAPANFPRVDRDTQRARDDSRRKILEDELAQEERSLGRARQDLTEQATLSQRTPGAGGDRVRSLQDAVDRHERNIAAIRKELSNIR